MDLMHPTMRQALSAFIQPAAASSLNDDDLYVINLRTRTIVQEHGCSSASAQVARIDGLPIKPGHALVTGMAARHMGLVS